jgi:HlyD family secretion protein
MKVRALTAEVTAAQARCEQLEAPARTDEVREAEARVSLAEAEQELAKIRLEQCELRAPVNGCVLDVHAELGDLLGPESMMPGLILADTSRLRVRAYVEEIDAPRLRAGAPAIVTADGLPGETFKGTVESVSPRMSAKREFSDEPNELYDTKVREVLVSLSDAQGLIMGLRVDVKFEASIIRDQGRNDGAGVQVTSVGVATNSGGGPGAVRGEYTALAICG